MLRISVRPGVAWRVPIGTVRKKLRQDKNKQTSLMRHQEDLSTLFEKSLWRVWESFETIRTEVTIECRFDLSVAHTLLSNTRPCGFTTMASCTNFNKAWSRSSEDDFHVSGSLSDTKSSDHLTGISSRDRVCDRRCDSRWSL
jgi:hypothetical protein